MEIWKAIPNYEDRYEISNFGRARSLKTNKFLSPNIMSHGYTCIHLYRGGKSTRKVKTLHQLVAQLFIANIESCREVNHKDFDRANNHIDNLEWVTRKQNVHHALAAGRRVKPEKKVKGINLKTKIVIWYESQIAAEIALRGAQTGGISWALKNNRPVYGYVWWLE